MGIEDGRTLVGFFEDKAADAKAHGVEPPKKKTKEEAYADFMTAIAADVKDAEEKEQEEAVTAAQDREAREAFEQRYLLHPFLSARAVAGIQREY